jgi:hypothetical protein
LSLLSKTQHHHEKELVCVFAVPNDTIMQVFLKRAQQDTSKRAAVLHEHQISFSNQANKDVLVAFLKSIKEHRQQSSVSAGTDGTISRQQSSVGAGTDSGGFWGDLLHTPSYSSTRMVGPNLLRNLHQSFSCHLYCPPINNQTLSRTEEALRLLEAMPENPLIRGRSVHTGSTGFKGVYLNRGRYIAQCCTPPCRHLYINIFATVEDAALAFLRHQQQNHGHPGLLANATPPVLHRPR